MPRNKSEAEPVLVRTLIDSSAGSQKLWKVGDEHIVTSKMEGGFVHGTYVFHANAGGRITSYAELDGSQKDDVPHEVAIAAYYVYTRQAHLLRPL